MIVLILMENVKSCVISWKIFTEIRQIGERIKFNIYDVVDLAVEIKDIANTIYTKITGKAPKELENDPLQIPSDTELQNTILHKTRKKIGRNEPCPCGRGLKYKKCCSKIDPRTGERV